MKAQQIATLIEQEQSLNQRRSEVVGQLKELIQNTDPGLYFLDETHVLVVRYVDEVARRSKSAPTWPDILHGNNEAVPTQPQGKKVAYIQELIKE